MKKLQSINLKGVQSQIVKGDWITLIILATHWAIFYVHQFVAPSEVSAALLGITFFPAMIAPAVGMAVYIEKTRKWWILVIPFALSLVAGVIFAAIVDPFMDFWFLYAFMVFLVPAFVLTYYVTRAVEIRWTK